MHSPFSFLRKWKDQSHRCTSYFQNEVIASTTWNNGKHALLLLPPPPRGPLWRFRLCSHVSAGEYLAWAAKAGCQKLVYTIPFMRIAWFFFKKNPSFLLFMLEQFSFLVQNVLDRKGRARAGWPQSFFQRNSKAIRETPEIKVIPSHQVHFTQSCKQYFAPISSRNLFRLFSPCWRKASQMELFQMCTGSEKRRGEII